MATGGRSPRCMQHLPCAVLMILTAGLADYATAGGGAMGTSEVIRLPAPVGSGDESLEALLARRRSVREFAPLPLTLAQVGQLAWAAQGVTHGDGLRTAPSAGALYPLELYVVGGDVDGLRPGVYHYLPADHRLEQTGEGDRRQRLSAAAFGQTWVGEAAAVFVFAGVYERTTWKYGERGLRYVHMEIGHAAQNLFLQAEALGLSTVVVGAFDDAAVTATLELPAGVRPFSMLPVGRRQSAGP